MISAAFESLASAAPAGAARRRRLRLNVATRVGPSSAQVVLVHDISTTGLLLETEARLVPGEAITVQLPEASDTAARVMWSSGQFYGCQFDRPIPGAAISAALLRSPFDEPEPAPAARRAAAAAPSLYDLPWHVERGSLPISARLLIVVVASMLLWLLLLQAVALI